VPYPDLRVEERANSSSGSLLISSLPTTSLNSAEAQIDLRLKSYSKTPALPAVRASLRAGPRYWLRRAIAPGRLMFWLSPEHLELPDRNSAPERYSARRCRPAATAVEITNFGFRRTAFAGQSIAGSRDSMARSSRCWISPISPMAPGRRHLRDRARSHRKNGRSDCPGRSARHRFRRRAATGRGRLVRCLSRS